MLSISLRIKTIGLLLVILSMTAMHCSVRKHDNVFDPKSGIDTLDMPLQLRRADSVITLTWTPHYQAEIEGFHLYRKVGNETHFSSLAILPASQTEYKDSLVQYDTPYAYYLTLIGASTESPPTRVLKTIPGPGQIWILDRWNEYILKYSYDMRHILLRHYAIWIPQALTFNATNTIALITYPAYHYVEVLDPLNGALQGEITKLSHPFACSFNRHTNEFWLSDSSGGLYRFSPGQGLQLLSTAAIRPLEIAFDAQGQAIVLDARQQALLLFNADGSQRLVIKDFKGHPFFDLRFLSSNANGSYFYFIDQRDTSNILYRLSALTDSVSELFRQKGLAIARENVQDHSLWLAINTKDQAKILQLSAAGIRLNTRNGFKFITDLAINPINGNLVVADFAAHRVVHLRPDGTQIGVYEKAPYPFKVYIE